MVKKSIFSKGGGAYKETSYRQATSNGYSQSAYKPESKQQRPKQNRFNLVATNEMQIERLPNGVAKILKNGDAITLMPGLFTREEALVVVNTMMEMLEPSAIELQTIRMFYIYPLVSEVISRYIHELPLDREITSIPVEERDISESVASAVREELVPCLSQIKQGLTELLINVQGVKSQNNNINSRLNSLEGLNNGNEISATILPRGKLSSVIQSNLLEV